MELFLMTDFFFVNWSHMPIVFDFLYYFFTSSKLFFSGFLIKTVV